VVRFALESKMDGDYIRSMADSKSDVIFFMQPRMEMNLEEFFENKDTNMANLAEIDTYTVFNDIFDALDHIHAGGYIHYDNKPTNLALNCKPWSGAVLDLGSSKEEKWSEDYHAGTVEFHAPEVRELRERKGAMAMDSSDTTTVYWSAALCLAEFFYPEERLTMFWSWEDGGKGVIDDGLKALIEDLRY